MTGKSPTWELVEKIEALTGQGWSQEKRAAVADMIREYRFDQIAFVTERIQKLVRESGNKELSEKLHTGKY